MIFLWHSLSVKITNNQKKPAIWYCMHVYYTNSYAAVKLNTPTSYYKWT